MNRAQQKALDYFRQHLTSNLSKNPAYGDTVTVFNAEPTSYGTLWITARTEMVGLPEGNVLRCVSAEHWFVSVGKRGALTVKMGPKSLKQFKGRKFMGLNIDY